MLQARHVMIRKSTESLFQDAIEVKFDGDLIGYIIEGCKVADFEVSCVKDENGNVEQLGMTRVKLCRLN